MDRLGVTKLYREESTLERKHSSIFPLRRANMSGISPTFFRRMLAIMSLALWSPALQAQDSHPEHVSKPPADRKGWHVTPRVRIVETFDDNPFLLSDAGKARLSALSASSLTSGRYTNMAGGNDYITSMRGGLNAEGPGILGRKLTLGADARYAYYQLNARRRNLFYELRVAQALGHGSHLGARAELQPKYFFRNYLADAVDLNRNGTIEPDERVYAAGAYSDQEFAGEFRQRLLKSTEDHPFGAQLTLEAGRKARTFEQPFQTRGYAGPFASVIGAVAVV